MKKEEKEEVKKIVDEAMEENREELKKEKKSKKKIIIISSIVGGILLAVAIVFLLMFLLKPRYKVTLKDGGGVVTKEVVIEDNVVKEMPEITPPKGKELVTWINKKKEAVRPGLPLPSDDTWEPVWREDNAETVTIRFESGTDEKIPEIKIPKGSGLIIPVKPNNYKDWKFLYWVDKDEYIALIGTPVNKDTTLYAYWWKPGTGGTPKKTATIKFDTGTDETFEDLNLIIGSKYIFYTPEKPNGKKVFRGWLDDKGNLLTSDSLVERDMTLKANWKDPYTCPQDCSPSEDGKTCTKKLTASPSTREVCPGEDYEDFEGNKFCIADTTNIDVQNDCNRQCSSGYPFGDTEVDVPIVREGLAAVCCVKKLDRVTEYTCPEGYNREGDICSKTETINCTAN